MGLALLEKNQASVFLPLKRQVNCTSRVVCFPFAGSSPYIFAGWPSRFGPDVEVVALQTPARALRLQEAPYSRLEEIIAEATNAFDQISDIPFVFYGHSLGAAIAFELTRALRRKGKPEPSHLFVGAARPPHFAPLQPTIHRLPQEEFLDAVQARYGGVPEAVAREPELMSIFLPALLADFSVYENYEMVPELPLHCPITAFCGSQDTLVTPHAMEEWQCHTGANFHLEILAGDHFFLGPHIDALTARIRNVLKNTMPGSEDSAGVQFNSGSAEGRVV